MRWLTLLLAAAVTVPAPADETASPSWRSDVRFLVSRVESIHPDPFRTHDREVWEEEARRLGATIDDLEQVELPASGLMVEISELYWQPSDPRDRRPWITPDIPAPITSGDFFNHRDPAIEVIRRFRASPALIEGFGPPVHRWRRANQAD
jgi:hypothetical protein